MPEMADAVAQAVQYSDSMMEAVFQLGRAEADADIRTARTYPVVNGFSQYHGQWEQRDEVSGTVFSPFLVWSYFAQAYLPLGSARGK